MNTKTPDRFTLEGFSTASVEHTLYIPVYTFVNSIVVANCLKRPVGAAMVMLMEDGLNIWERRQQSLGASIKQAQGQSLRPEPWCLQFAKRMQATDDWFRSLSNDQLLNELEAARFYTMRYCGLAAQLLQTEVERRQKRRYTGL